MLVNFVVYKIFLGNVMLIMKLDLLDTSFLECVLQKLSRHINDF